jgi:hypothetical protein
LAELLTRRLAAYKAFDKARAVSRSALGWVLSQLHRWVEATGGLGVLSWVSDHAKYAVGPIREPGSCPPLWPFCLRHILPLPPSIRPSSSGGGLVRIAKAAWTGIKSLLGRCGSTGTLITESLSHTGTQIAETVKAVAKHPMMAPVVHAIKATLALVRPVGLGCVANRLLAALVPVPWLRAMIAFLVMPFLVNSTLVGNVWEWATTRPATPKSNDTEGADDGDLLINTFAIPMPGRTVPSDEQPEVAEQDNTQDDNEPADEEPFSNRASRRAQQREDAHAWRMQQQHR